MNYLRAMQRLDGRFDFTTENDGRVSPAGYCRPWREWDETTKQMSPAAWEQYVADKGKYHDHGHATAEEAAACYRDYLLDHNLVMNCVSSNSQHRCEVCGEWTDRWARTDTSMGHLCAEHNNRAEIEKLFTLSGGTLLMMS